jgi:hypothetical protein
MSEGCEISCRDYVNRYEQVRNALSKDALATFQSATNAAVRHSRNGAVAAGMAGGENAKPAPADEGRPFRFIR